MPAKECHVLQIDFRTNRRPFSPLRRQIRIDANSGLRDRQIKGEELPQGYRPQLRPVEESLIRARVKTI